MNYNKIYIRKLSLFISIIIFSTFIFILNINHTFLQIGMLNCQIANSKVDVSNKIDSIGEKDDSSIEIQNKIKENTVNKIDNEYNERIEIPSMNISAKIQYGIDEDVLSKYIGKYKESNEEKIALLAYNYGTNRVNYFANLKDLEYGDKIVYSIENNKYDYIVIANKMVKSDLETVNNIREKCIMLFTYIMDMPDSMRCVIAKPI